jgi:hypothetical protein
VNAEEANAAHVRRRTFRVAAAAMIVFVLALVLGYLTIVRGFWHVMN